MPPSNSWPGDKKLLEIGCVTGDWYLEISNLNLAADPTPDLIKTKVLSNRKGSSNKDFSDFGTLMTENELYTSVPDVRTNSTPAKIPDDTRSTVSRYILLVLEAMKDPVPVKGALVTLIFAGSENEEATRLVTLPKVSKS